MNQTPEQKARDTIDRMLQDAGWAVQNMSSLNWSASPGIAVREYQTEIGPADYVLFVDGKPCGVIEAKREEEGHRLTTHEKQAEDYARSQLKWVADSQPLPFVYESTGILTRFTDTRDPYPRAREVFSFHRPETLTEWQKQTATLRSRLGTLPPLPPAGLRACQINAITNLEDSFQKNRPRALIQMATGSGKTFTAITSIYRLLKHVDAKRILFLVDTRNLGEQAEQEFMSYTPGDENRLFTELYNVQRLNSSYVAKDSQVCISTIQRMYSILRGESLDERAEETNPNELQISGTPKEVVYNSQLPPDFFDFIIIDECHRSIYNIWQQVLDYFDAFLIGLTATPDKRTFGFFNENVVSEYTHEDAVADDVNVGFDTYLINTRITKQGSVLEAREYVDKRERLTRRRRWTQLDEDVAYSGKELDRDVVNVSQIRSIIRTFRDQLPNIFPGREEVPKTLIFAKTDSHADDIINIVREEFAQGNDFCKKVTYRATENPKSILAAFRNDYNPRIAVTVDMIATGTDVKPLECLVFMRDVRSKNYFEQMKGRGTRTLGYDDMKKVTPSVQSRKTHFVIVDAVGVSESLKTDSRPLERKRTVPLKDLLAGVLMGINDEDTFTSLASRLSRLSKQIDERERAQIGDLAGQSINQLVHGLLKAHNPDEIEATARSHFQLAPDALLSEPQLAQARQLLSSAVQQSFNGPLNEFIENVRKVHEQIIDTINRDEVTFAGWDTQARERAENIVEEFQTFLREHKDEITALRIFYDQPYRRREVTYQMIREVAELIQQQKPALAPPQVWQAYAQLDNLRSDSPKNELVALVALLRRVCGIDASLTPYESIVNRNFQDWIFQKHAGKPKFNEAQMDWLRMIKSHIASSIHMEREDLERAPFDAHGGLGRMYQLFGEEMEPIIDELNEALVA